MSCDRNAPFQLNGRRARDQGQAVTASAVSPNLESVRGEGRGSGERGWDGQVVKEGGLEMRSEGGPGQMPETPIP